MAPTTLQFEVTSDHPVPVEPSLGGSVTVLNVSGDTLYYADSQRMSATNNQGSLTATQSATFFSPQWMVSASLSTVTVTVNDPSTSTVGSATAAALTPTPVKSANYTAATGEFVPCNISGGSFAITLPTAPLDKSRVGVKLTTVDSAHTNTLTINAGGADVFNRAAGSTALTLSALFQGLILQYESATGIWYVQSLDASNTQPLGAGTLGRDGYLGGAGGSPLANRGVSGPGGTGGANTGATTTIPAPTTFDVWWGVANVSTTITLPTPVFDYEFLIVVDEPAAGGNTIALSGATNTPNGVMQWQTAASSSGLRNALLAKCVDGSHWDLYPVTGPPLLTDRGAWAASTAYSPHDFVTYGGTSWICLTAHTSGSTFDETKFATLGGGFRGVFQATTRYLANDIVLQGGVLYSANATFTSTGSFVAGNWTSVSSAGGAANYTGLFGDGSDGAATLDGSATVTWATLTNPGASGIYTMNAGCNLTSLTVNAGITLITTGWRIKCQGTVSNAGTIHANGTSATAGALGTAATAGTVGVGQTGKVGGTGVGTGGTAGVVGGNSGQGGSGTAGAGGGVGAAVITTAAVAKNVFAQPDAAVCGTFLYTTSTRTFNGGGGGGSGAGDNTNTSGAGGNGGSPLVIFAHAFTNTGTVSSTGGNGGTPATGNCGGGGGGGGGFVLVYTLSAATMGTVTLTGGTHGNGVGTGAVGTDGSTGISLNIVLA